jgi:hypothetical protein
MIRTTQKLKNYIHEYSKKNLENDLNHKSISLEIQMHVISNTAILLERYTFVSNSMSVNI